jgi:hypothetical protein
MSICQPQLPQAEGDIGPTIDPQVDNAMSVHSTKRAQKSGTVVVLTKQE